MAQAKGVRKCQAARRIWAPFTAYGAHGRPLEMSQRLNAVVPAAVGRPEFRFSSRAPHGAPEERTGAPPTWARTPAPPGRRAQPPRGAAAGLRRRAGARARWRRGGGARRALSPLCDGCGPRISTDRSPLGRGSSAYSSPCSARTSATSSSTARPDGGARGRAPRTRASPAVDHPVLNWLATQRADRSNGSSGRPAAPRRRRAPDADASSRYLGHNRSHLRRCAKRKGICWLLSYLTAT